MKFKKGDLVKVKGKDGIWEIIEITETQFSLKDRDNDSRFLFIEYSTALKDLELVKEEVTIGDLKKRLKPGMWVRYKLSDLPEWRIGYIEEIDSSKCISIRKVPNNTMYYKYNTQFFVLPDMLHPDDRKALIDLALDLRDEEWFYELTKDL